jgi:predicted ATPase
MITQISAYAFKRFEDQVFRIGSVSVLAGPNNSGKSTLLQAIMVWNLAMQKWCEKKGPDSGSKASKRAGAPITRQEFSALPLPSMDQLWTDTHTSLRKGEVEGKGAGTPRPMVITIEGIDAANNAWKFGFEFRYSGPEQIHVKPVAEDLEFLEKAQNEVSVIYVPPFSGIGVNETRYDRPYQDMLVGQGKGGDILRNLLLEVSEKEEDWNRLVQIIEITFQYRLLKPEYTGTPHITCQYLKGVPAKGRGLGGYAPLDLSTTGSGFHQVLLILAFVFARPSSLVMLDEPDAHLHVLLQKELYDLLLSICHKRRGQLVIATHSEVLIDSTSPQHILSFYQKPHSLRSKSERDRVREALKRVSSLDLLLVEDAKGVVYLEGTTDFDLLKAWARILEHPLSAWFSNMPFWKDNKGRQSKDAKTHYFALKSIHPELKAMLLLDGDNRGMSDFESGNDGLEVIFWERYEAESYLLHPDVLRRYITKERGELIAGAALKVLEDNLPPAFFKNPLALSPVLKAEPASKTLLPQILFDTGIDLGKGEYFLIAEEMRKEEIPNEVIEKLDAISRIVQ